MWQDIANVGLVIYVRGSKFGAGAENCLFVQKRGLPILQKIIHHDSIKMVPSRSKRSET